MRGYSLPDEDTLRDVVGLPARDETGEDAKTIPVPGKARSATDDEADDGTPTNRVPPKPAEHQPLVEIEVIHEHGPAPATETPWRTVEVWTRNRVYALDSGLLCFEVVDRGTQAVIGEHPFLGLRLVGGQHREGESIELSSPFPRPGTEAVFEQVGMGRGGTFSRTSAVTRVVLRLHIVTVAPNSVVPTWAEITHSFGSPMHAAAPEGDAVD